MANRKSSQLCLLFFSPHRKCIHLREWFDYQNHICMVFDLCGQSVYDFLKVSNFKPFSLRQIQQLGKQILTSVECKALRNHTSIYLFTDPPLLSFRCPWVESGPHWSKAGKYPIGQPCISPGKREELGPSDSLTNPVLLSLSLSLLRRSYRILQPEYCKRRKSG